MKSLVKSPILEIIVITFLAGNLALISCTISLVDSSACPESINKNFLSLRQFVLNVSIVEISEFFLNITKPPKTTPAASTPLDLPCCQFSHCQTISKSFCFDKLKLNHCANAIIRALATALDEPKPDFCGKLLFILREKSQIV